MAAPGGARSWPVGMPAGTRPCFLLARADAVPAALLPLRRSSSGQRTGQPDHPLHLPLCATVGAGPRRSGAGDGLTAFARFCRGWATTRLDALPDDWPALPACVEGARSRGTGGGAIRPFRQLARGRARAGLGRLPRRAAGSVARDDPAQAAPRVSAGARPLHADRWRRGIWNPASPRSSRSTHKAGSSRSRSRCSMPR